LGFDLLVQVRILLQQGFLRACALETNGKGCEQEKRGKDPARRRQETTPIRTSLQNAFAMHWPHGRVCHRKRKVQLCSSGVGSGGPKGNDLHSRLSSIL